MTQILGSYENWLEETWKIFKLMSSRESYIINYLENLASFKVSVENVTHVTEIPRKCFQRNLLNTTGLNFWSLKPKPFSLVKQKFSSLFDFSFFYVKIVFAEKLFIYFFVVKEMEFIYKKNAENCFEPISSSYDASFSIKKALTFFYKKLDFCWNFVESFKVVFV